MSEVGTQHAPFCDERGLPPPPPRETWARGLRRWVRETQPSSEHLLWLKGTCREVSSTRDTFSRLGRQQWPSTRGGREGKRREAWPGRVARVLQTPDASTGSRCASNRAPVTPQRAVRGPSGITTQEPWPEPSGPPRLRLLSVGDPNPARPLHPDSGFATVRFWIHGDFCNNFLMQKKIYFKNLSITHFRVDQ